MKAYNLINKLKENDDFSKFIEENIQKGKIRYFDEEEWSKIEKQNFFLPDTEINNFKDIFELGLNIGSCSNTSKQLSYSYEDVDLVYGDLPLIKGSYNSALGEHAWIETRSHIIDTSLMLVIDLSLKEAFGYRDNERATARDLARNNFYQARKTFVNDSSLRSKRR